MLAKTSCAVAVRGNAPEMTPTWKNMFVVFNIGTFCMILYLLIHHRTNYIRVVSNVGTTQLDINSESVYQLTRAGCQVPKLATISPKCPSGYIMNKTEDRDYEKFLQLSQKSNYSEAFKQNFTSKIVILTPVSNAASHLAHYFHLLCSLSYPHELISIALGEDTSTDKTFSIAKVHADKLEHHFRKISVFRSAEGLRQRPAFTRHDPGFQRVRRGHLALARNQLMARGITDEDWVLWIDSDVKYVPPDLIQHLLSAEKDIVAPSCMYTAGTGVSLVYDRNTWRETNRSKEFLSKVNREFLMLEGYDESKRIYLPAIHKEGNVVKIDGVGGCVLLVRANCHRKGLIFPPFVFENHIETEGLAKMAARMGFELCGLPHVWTFHS